LASSGFSASRLPSAAKNAGAFAVGPAAAAAPALPGPPPAARALIAACLGLLGIHLLQEAELLRRHHVAADLQLAGGEQLHRVRLAWSSCR
jgi:hypothetical protein